MACRCCGGLPRRSLLAGAALAAALPLAGCDAAVPDWLADLLVPGERGGRARCPGLPRDPGRDAAGARRRAAAAPGRRRRAHRRRQQLHLAGLAVRGPGQPRSSTPSPCRAARSACSPACCGSWPTRRSSRPSSATRSGTSTRATRRSGSWPRTPWRWRCAWAPRCWPMATRRSRRSWWWRWAAASPMSA